MDDVPVTALDVLDVLTGAARLITSEFDQLTARLVDEHGDSDAMVKGIAIGLDECHRMWQQIIGQLWIHVAARGAS